MSVQCKHYSYLVIIDCLFLYGNQIRYNQIAIQARQRD